MQRVQAPQPARFSTWRNPTKDMQYVDILDGEGANQRTTRHEIPPGGSIQIPSHYDRAIHLVDCGQDECHRRGGYFCTKGHPGIIMGGLAPQLVRDGAEETLSDACDPHVQAKKQAEAQMAAEDIKRRAAEDGLLLAQKRAQEAASASSDDKPEPAKPGRRPPPSMA